MGEDQKRDQEVRGLEPGVMLSPARGGVEWEVGILV